MLLIHRHGGLAVAAHVDRRSFSVPGQLGFIPPDVPFDGLEISAAGVAQGRAAEFAAHGLPLLCSSDGHFLNDIGCGFTVLEVRGAHLRRDRPGPAREGWAGGAPLREISLHILDLIENSIRAGAAVIAVSVEEEPAEDSLIICVEDDGPGLSVSARYRRRTLSSRRRKERRPAWALSLLKFRAEQAGGSFRMEQLLPRRTWRCGRDAASHVDRSPLGDLAATLASVVCTNPGGAALPAARGGPGVDGEHGGHRPGRCPWAARGDRPWRGA